MSSIQDDSYWNNIILDPVFDVDELFSSTFNFVNNDTYKQPSVIIKDEYDEKSLLNEV